MHLQPLVRAPHRHPFLPRPHAYLGRNTVPTPTNPQDASAPTLFPMCRTRHAPCLPGPPAEAHAGRLTYTPFCALSPHLYATACSRCAVRLPPQAYLGRQFGLMPADPRAAAHVEQLLAVVTDGVAEGRLAFHPKVRLGARGGKGEGSGAAVKALGVGCIPWVHTHTTWPGPWVLLHWHNRPGFSACCGITRSDGVAIYLLAAHRGQLLKANPA